MGFFDGLISGLTDDYEGTDDSGGSILGAAVGGFLNGVIGASGADMSLDEWVEQYSDSRKAAGVYLQLEHSAFAKECTINAVILDHNENAIDSNSWELPWDADVKKLMQGKKEIYFSFDD